MSKTTLIEQIKADLGYLKLARTGEVFAQLAEEARAREEDPLEVLAKVVTCEVDATRQRRLSARLGFAHFPFRRTLEEFDFDFQPSIDPRWSRIWPSSTSCATAIRCCCSEDPAAARATSASPSGSAPSRPVTAGTSPGRPR